MNYMPFFFDLKGRECLIVGGGSIATRKARLLSKAGAKLIVVAPYITDEMQKMVAANSGECHLRGYESKDLERGVVIICATDNSEINQRVSIEAQAKRLPVNVVDSPTLCSIITPAIVDRSPLMIAITSGGDAPVLARQMRAKLEVLFPSAYGALATLAAKYRHRVKEKVTSEAKRLRFWEQVFNGAVAEKAFVGKIDEAEQAIETQLNDDANAELTGEVYLVGGGPGDPDLLTFKALRLMQQADVVLYDRLVSEPVMNLVRRDADRIYVGKRSSDHAVPQQDINQMLVDLAQQGKRVLRLKGGDPFIFGRGGEEIELLAQNNVAFQVVPGITAASGCAAYSGIPLTHRDHAQSVRFITGHTKAGNIDLPWESLLDAHQTLVFYMGLMNLEPICAELLVRGRDAETPAALIEKGTTPQQRVIIGTLSTLPDLIKGQEVHAPTLLIIGGVVSLHEQLQWYKN
ncbi:MAG: uroporphyrin-III C-methyltransferase/precorrin-2 dehydrogenase/sirohydrochlorin ferrochelatase [Candidatus Endobugula sp.]|jgi:uroporphyrin-III C-methyltransferase/precorrin-2 dehydrogenase/sirohydrochlorin ferrochelatase